MGAMSRRTIIASVVAGVVAVSAAAGGFMYLNHLNQVRLDADARTSANRFASAWSHRDVHGLTYVGQPAAQVAASFRSTTGGLGSAPAKVTVTSLTRDGDKANSKLSVAWTVAGGTTWTYPITINLQRNTNGAWPVVAKDGASMWAPGLSPTAKLVATRTSGARGEVLDRNGVPMLTVGKVYDVAIDPTRASAQTIAELEKLVNEPAGALVASSTPPRRPIQMRQSRSSRFATPPSKASSRRWTPSSVWSIPRGSSRWARPPDLCWALMAR
jgi:hypothetical protein